MALVSPDCFAAACVSMSVKGAPLNHEPTSWNVLPPEPWKMRPLRTASVEPVTSKTLLSDRMLELVPSPMK